MRLQKTWLTILIAICAKPSILLGAAHGFLENLNKSTGSHFLKFIALFLCFPCFKASHFFFKLAYSLQQRRLMLACGEDFFLKFYDRPIANGSVVDVLQSLRHIVHGLESAQASKHFTNHTVSSNAESASPSA